MLKDRILESLADDPCLSQAGLARACGIKEPSVTNWVNGRTRTIKGPNLLAAAAYLGVSPQWLSSGRGAKKPLPGSGSFSHPVGPIDVTILHEALTLLGYDEEHGGEYMPRGKTRRLAELYAWLKQDGGVLSDESNAIFYSQVKGRQQGAAKHGRKEHGRAAE